MLVAVDFWACVVDKKHLLVPVKNLELITILVEFLLRSSTLDLDEGALPGCRQHQIDVQGFLRASDGTHSTPSTRCENQLDQQFEVFRTEQLNDRYQYIL
jgi:hypothetical protein